jgi:hypothetical protein
MNRRTGEQEEFSLKKKKIFRFSCPPVQITGG